MDFLFRGERLALDLVNTQVVVRGKLGDLLKSPADLEYWWKQAITRFAPILNQELAIEFDPVALQQIKELRGVVRRILEAICEGRSPTESDQLYLNQVLGSGYQVIDWVEGAKPRITYRLVRDSTIHPVVLEIALSFFRLVSEQDLKRLHKCANERCIFYFYDTTKSATRHWCSKDCMNRARSIKNYRKKQESRRKVE